MSATGKLVSEMKQAEDDFRDNRPTRTGCAFCSWTFKGTAAEGRDAAAIHRKEKHSDRPTRSRNEIVTEADRRRREEREKAYAAAHPRTRPAWTRTTAIAAYKDEVERLGYQPTSNDFRGQGGRVPSEPTVVKIFGSWSEYVVASGFPKPVRGGRRRRKDAEPPPTSPPLESPEERVRRLVAELLAAIDDVLTTAKENRE